MDKVLAETEAQLDSAKEVAVKRTREAFLNEVLDNILPKNVPGFSGTSSTATVFELRAVTGNLIATLKAFAQGKMPMAEYDKAVDACIAQFRKPGLIGLEYILSQTGYDPQVAKNVAKTVSGLHFIKAQFKELMISTSQLLKSNADVNLATSDIRRIMLGERGLSSVVESKIRGFKPGDTDPAAEDSNIVSSKELGAGAAGKTYLLTTKSGEELVFKPEMDSRIGLDDILLGSGNAYLDKQKTANLNLATQDTAKAFGCEDVVVKYSVGSHGGQFGFFMEKAKGSSGAGFGGKTASGGGGIPPNDLHKITDPGERTKIMADPVKKRAYLDTIRSRVSSEALEATSARIDEAIAYAKKLNESGKVYGKDRWRDWNKIVAMPGVKANVTVTNVNGDKLRVEGDIEIVSDYNERKCPSFFKREFLHRMFDKPV